MYFVGTRVEMFLPVSLKDKAIRLGLYLVSTKVKALVTPPKSEKMFELISNFIFSGLFLAWVKNLTIGMNNPPPSTVYKSLKGVSLWEL